MIVSTPSGLPHARHQKKTFKNRYRWYSVLVIMAVLPLLSADTFNFPQSVFTTGAEYAIDVTVAKKIQAKDYDPTQAVANIKPQVQIIKVTGQGIGAPEADSMAKSPIVSIGSSSNPDTVATNPIINTTPETQNNTETKPVVEDPAPEIPRIKTLQELVAKPESPQFVSQLVYPKTKIKAPIIWSKLEDLYEKSADGKIDVLKPIVEKESDIKAGNYESTPIQKLLKQGTVHLADSVMPGEVGNSYIIGHSSNYRQVISNYNAVFQTLPQAKEGDEFTIFDPEGRELKFKVFESIVIDYTDTSTAYKDYGERRIVTLQASVLVNGKPVKRRLVRGELVL